MIDGVLFEEPTETFVHIYHEIELKSFFRETKVFKKQLGKVLQGIISDLNLKKPLTLEDRIKNTFIEFKDDKKYKMYYGIYHKENPYSRFYFVGGMGGNSLSKNIEEYTIDAKLVAGLFIVPKDNIPLFSRITLFKHIKRNTQYEDGKWYTAEYADFPYLV